jgi:hypothetical protein
VTASTGRLCSMAQSTRLDLVILSSQRAGTATVDARFELLQLGGTPWAVWTHSGTLTVTVN